MSTRETRPPMPPGAAATVTLVVANRLDEIERISHDLDAFASRHGVPARVAFDANLALDEVLTNIISYAWDDDAAHEIVVRLRVERGHLVIEVEDDGRPFDPLAAGQPDLALPLEERPVGGLGLSIVRRLMPALRYERRGDRNVFTMSRLIASGGEGLETVVTKQEHPAGGVTVVRAGGRLDAASAAAFEEELLGRVAAGDRRIVVDCSGLRYINSAGLRVLLVAAKRLAGRGALALAGASGQIRSAVEIVGFDSIFPVCDTIEQATAAVLAAASRPPAQM